MISVVVSYAFLERQIEIPVMVEENCTIADAIALSHIRDYFPEILLDAAVGINGRIMTLGSLLHADDRVEIYRPLKINSQKARWLRANQQS